MLKRKDRSWLKGNVDFHVGKNERGDLAVSTVCPLMQDTEHLYETGIAHPEYNDGHWVIVEEYDSKEEAAKGHKQWVKRVDTDQLPECLPDVSSAAVASLLGPKEYKRERLH